MSRLIKSGVVFDEDEHRYYLNGKELVGITHILSDMLFKDEYAGVSRQVLHNAAKKGHGIHSEIEIFNNYGIEGSSEEFHAYKKLNLKVLESEYIVTDREHIASPIDAVCEGEDGTFDLVDFKTTYSLNIDKVMWQLSVYAWLFELQNPTLKVGKLYACHLRGNIAKMVEVKRIDSKFAKELFDCYFDCREFTNPLYPTKEDEELSQLLNIERRIAEIEEQAKALKEIQSTIRDRIKEEMKKNGIKKWETENMKITYKEESTREMLDSKRLKEENPAVYDMYSKKSVVSDSITIKLIV